MAEWKDLRLKEIEKEMKGGGSKGALQTLISDPCIFLESVLCGSIWYKQSCIHSFNRFTKCLEARFSFRPGNVGVGNERAEKASQRM